MSVLKYDVETNKWRKETKEECMVKEDIEGRKPCEKCWRKARNGVYVWPVTDPNVLKRCEYCGRVI